MTLARNWWPVPVAIALVLGPIRPAMAFDPFRQLSDEEQRRVDQGEIIVHLEKTDQPLKRFLVVGQIDAPAAKVYGVYTDFDHHTEVFGHRSCEIKRREGNTLWVGAVLEIPWPIGDRWVQNETRLFPEELSFTYKRVEGNIVEYNGSLDVVPRGPGRCQVYYTAKVDMGIPFLPRWFLDHIQEGQMPLAIGHVRNYLLRQSSKP